jgi:hypothetical protein
MEHEPQERATLSPSAGGHKGPHPAPHHPRPYGMMPIGRPQGHPVRGTVWS